MVIFLAAFTILLLFVVPALSDITLPAPVPAYNQAYRGASGYWGECSMGTNGCGDTIATDGCLITAFSMVLGYYNVDLSIPRASSCTDTARTGMDPGILNDWLKTHGGYGKCGNDVGSCCLEWTHLPPQISTTIYVNHSEHGVDSTAARTNDRSLSQGNPVICGVHWGSHCHGSTTQTEDCHWVVITGKKGSTYTIIDPYNRDTSDPAGVSTTLDHGTFGAYTIDRYVVVSGVVPSPRFEALRLSLSFSPGGLTESGTMQVRSLTISGTDHVAKLLLYIRVIDPHGSVSYAYYTSEAGGKLHYTRDKHSLYPTPRSFTNGTFVVDKETTAGEKAGTWTWEVWAEDPAQPGKPYGYDIAAYTIGPAIAQTQVGIVVALGLAVAIIGLIYVSILLRPGT